MLKVSTRQAVKPRYFLCLQETPVHVYVRVSTRRVYNLSTVQV